MKIHIPESHMKWCSVPYLVLPLKIRVSKKKMYYINMNTYRNANHHVTAAAKKAYTHMLFSMETKEIPFPPPYIFVYRMFYNRNAQFDVANFMSILDKFVSDALTMKEVIPDDSARYVKSTLYEFAGIKACPPYANMHIFPYSRMSLLGV